MPIFSYALFFICVKYYPFWRHEPPKGVMKANVFLIFLKSKTHLLSVFYFVLNNSSGSLQAGHHQQIQICRLNIKQLTQIIVGQAALVKINPMPKPFVSSEQFFDATGIP